jgi:hypothetical protein
LEDTAREGEDGTAVRVHAATQFDDFVGNPVLLGGEGEGGRASEKEFCFASSGDVESTRAYEKLDVGEGEWGGVGWGWRVGVLAGRSRKKKAMMIMSAMPRRK